MVWDRISWATCGFGEKGGRFFVWFAAAIIAPAIGYLFAGISYKDQIIKCTFKEPLYMVIKDFGTCLHFSIVTLSTVGYGNVTPLGIWSYLISAFQIIFGFLIVAMATSIIIRKMLR